MNVFTAIVAIVLWWLIRWVAWIFLAMPVVWVIQKFLHNKKHPLYKVFS
jgi:sorbitol-specific phosphotransferase system component IIC